MTLGAIRARWAAAGYENGPLGYPAGDEVCGTRDGGCYQVFQNGAINWTSKTGAWETKGAIRARWAATGFENGALGYPIAGEACDSASSSCYQLFQGGAVNWTPKTGAWETSGAIRTIWARTDYERGPLGYPTGAVASGLTQGGSYQPFQGGAIYSNPSAGTWPVYGGINASWARTGYEKGTLGYPVSGEVCGTKGGGCYQLFQNGAINWVPAIGGWETYGPIRNTWAKLGYENGSLGYPTSSVTCDGTLCTQTFQSGIIVYDTSKQEALPVLGGIYGAWMAKGGLTGKLGLPVTGEIPLPDGSGVKQQFVGGEIRWTQGRAIVSQRATD